MFLKIQLKKIQIQNIHTYTFTYIKKNQTKKQKKY